MKFVCLGFYDPDQYAELSEAEGRQMMETCLDYDDELRRGGHFIGGEALQTAENAVTLRIKNGAVDVTDGPYAETKELLGGILLLEARDLTHAIALMSQHPGVKVGPFEIRPADAEVNALIAARGANVVREQNGECDDPAIDLMLGVFRDHLTWLEDAVADIPDERLAEQLGGVVNHPAWTLSHLNASLGFLLSLLDETEGDSAEEENQKYGYGSIPVTDRSHYASQSKLLATLRQRHELVDTAVRAKHTEYFSRATPEKLREFAPTIGRIAIYLLASHESYHLGQIMQWRRAAGFKNNDIF
ncbi:YCII-related domain protein [Symmachiella macrocystis]|uniref:YCII-related domain protein n=1 Tax=Symmachiella macrocystis TaxID=2527985 RepID=A0A5C6BER2_9PLAN|nr:YciI family protein [Symmachiella macrocystis]TWU08954.1 YCII-related domain protein [Symmachiella macrocystis]